MLADVFSFFSSEDFMPHGHCFLWLPQILWLHVASDALIALAYYSIPASLLYFVASRRDIPFKRLFYLFGSFILLCGTTHIMAIWVVWHPDYAAEGVLKAVTALVSMATALISWRIIPKALELRSPAELEKVNAQLLRSYDDVEHKVQERTAELTTVNAQLQESQRELQEALTQAQQASVAKTEFLANMSHEIRTPMNAVVGLSSLLDKGDIAPTKQKEMVRTLQLSAQALMDLLNDLLDVAKLESDMIKLEQIPFSLTELAEEIISIMSVRAKEKGVGLFVKYNKDLNQNFLGDPLRLRQVLMNLISNAVKFTERGAVNVQIEAAENKTTGAWDVAIDVIDTGIGIPSSKIETIFNKFSQADTSITRKFGGTGLGLSISKTLVSLMGGKISALSTVGLGSKFKVEIPFMPAEALIAPPEDIPTPRRGGAKPQVADKKQPVVLLVEDYQANILVATSTIENCGYQWELAENGQEALDKFKTGNYDLVLMDLQLSSVDGITATMAIREWEIQRNKTPTPIIGLTAYSRDNDRESFLKIGINDYLTKPYSPEDLRAKMMGLLAG